MIGNHGHGAKVLLLFPLYFFLCAHSHEIAFGRHRRLDLGELNLLLLRMHILENLALRKKDMVFA